MQIQLREPEPKDDPASAGAAATSLEKIAWGRVNGLFERFDVFALSTTAAIVAELYHRSVAAACDNAIFRTTYTLFQRLVANEVRVSKVRD